MPIVFVHGVNTRKAPSYDAGTRVTEAFLRKHLSDAVIGGRALAAPATTFPYWGDLGMTFAFAMSSLPRPQMQALGGTPDVTMQELLGHVRDAFPDLPRDNPLTALAKKRLPLAVDAINHLALRTVAKGDEAAVAEFVVAASTYVEAFRTRRGSRRCSRIRICSISWLRRFRRKAASRRSAALETCSTRSRPPP